MIVVELMLRQSRKEIKSMKNILISKNEWKNAQVTHCLIEHIETTHRRYLNSSYTDWGLKKCMRAALAKKRMSPGTQSSTYSYIVHK